MTVIPLQSWLICDLLVPFSNSQGHLADPFPEIFWFDNFNLVTPLQNPANQLNMTAYIELQYDGAVRAFFGN